MIKEEQLLYEALQRQNDSLSKRMILSEGFSERLMLQIDKRKTKGRHIYSWIYASIAAVAASVALFMVFIPRSNQNNVMPAKITEQLENDGIRREDMALTPQAEEREVPQRELLTDRPPCGKLSKAEIKPDAKEGLIEQVHDSTLIVQTSAAASQKRDEYSMSSMDSTCFTSPMSASTDPNLHYASDITSNDSSYISPALMDEFIKKLATHYGVESDNSFCTADSTHADMVCAMYLFPDSKDIDLFGRLLLAAIAFDDSMPGYLLNYSRQQFFFTINDRLHERKYLWIAERIGNDKIMLYCSNSSIGEGLSSECFQKYRNKIIHQINPKTIEL